MEEKKFLGSKRLLFKTEKEESNNKKPKLEENKLKEEKNINNNNNNILQNKLEEEFDYYQKEYIGKVCSKCKFGFKDSIFSSYKEDYTFYSYNNLKELENNTDFNSKIKQIIKNNLEEFNLYCSFLNDRSKYIELGKKYNYNEYLQKISELKKNNDISTGLNDEYNSLDFFLQREIFIVALFKQSFENIQKDEERYDTSINKDLIKNKEIKIEAQNFNLKGNSLITFLNALKFNENIISINLNGNELSKTSCYHLGTIFKYNHNIKLLSLSRCNLDNKCLEMFVMGATYSNKELNKSRINLESLILKENEKINGISDMCNNYCVSLILEKFAIKKLNLSKTKIGNEGLKNICKTLLGIYNEENNINENNNLYSLEALNLFNIDIKNEDGLEFLGKVVSHEKCKIETLILSKNKITQFFFDEKNNNNKNKNEKNYYNELMLNLGKNKSIKELFLLNCEIGKNKDDINILSQMLENNNTLESLRMFDNYLNDSDDFKKILEIFSDFRTPIRNKNLKSLDLSKNRCNIRISEELLNIIDYLNLEYLDINQNKMEEKEKELFRKRTNALERIKIIY